MNLIIFVFWMLSILNKSSIVVVKLKFVHFNHNSILEQNTFLTNNRDFKNIFKSRFNCENEMLGEISLSC